MTEELIRIGSNICPIYDKMASVINLSRFKQKLHTLQVIYTSDKHLPYKIYTYCSSLAAIILRFLTTITIWQGSTTPNYSTRLKVILSAVVQHLNGAPPTVTSEITSTGNVMTYISGNNFEKSYKSAPMVPTDEAEATAIYKFLRHKTNVLGYNIVDLNYPTLVNVVSQIDKYNQEVNELLLCARKAAVMIQNVHRSISKAYENLLHHIS